MTDLRPEEDRLLVELADLYEVWVDAQRLGASGRLRWKTVSGQDYLYRLRPGSDTGASLGARTPELEALFERHQQAQDQAKATWARLLVKGRMLKAARVPLVPSDTGDVLRALDVAGLLGSHLRVVGSMALPAYEIAAGVKLDPALHATEDMDFTWIAGPTSGTPVPELGDVFKRADATWTVNQEREFQLRNRHGAIIDVLIAPSLQEHYPSWSSVRPIATPGQEWLLLGQPLERTTVDLQGKPVRIVAPDPRVFALHKLLMAQDPTRRREKASKDLRQGEAILALLDRMPEYPLDTAFWETCPEPLTAAFAARASTTKPPSGRKP